MYVREGGHAPGVRGSTVKRAIVLATLAAGVSLLALPGSRATALPDEFFGVAPAQRPEGRDFNRMASGGVGTVRVQVSWPATEPSRDTYDWRRLDATVAGAARAGIRVLPFITAMPYWAVFDPEDGDPDTEPGGGAYFPPIYSRGMRTQWREFLRHLVNRYGPYGSLWRDPDGVGPAEPPPRLPIRSWQIWNEQNSSAFWKPEPSPVEYGRLLRISAAAIRGTDPRARIVLGGMFAVPAGIDAHHYLGRLYRNVPNVERDFDAVAVHPYARRIAGVEEQIKRIRKKLRDADDGRTPLWVTEIGWSTAGPEDHPLVRTRQGQARMLRRAFRLLRRQREQWRIERVTWYTWRDHDQACDWCHSAGLVGRHLRPKPAWYAFKRFAAR
jgi:polysaccharide biosynthesis protein PslG